MSTPQRELIVYISRNDAAYIVWLKNELASQWNVLATIVFNERCLHQATLNLDIKNDPSKEGVFVSKEDIRLEKFLRQSFRQYLVLRTL